MMIQNRRGRAPETSGGETIGVAHGVSQQVRNALLDQIATGARGFEVPNRDSPADIEAFQAQVRAVESLVTAGLVTIGARELAAGSEMVVAVRRIRLTEAGKRRVAAGHSE